MVVNDFYFVALTAVCFAALALLIARLERLVDPADTDLDRTDPHAHTDGSGCPVLGSPRAGGEQ